MASKDNRPEDAADLRRQAEERARETAAQSPKNLEALSSPVGDFQGSSEETRRMLHELRVHQIELEMQNEELRRAQADLEAAGVRYFDLYDLAPVGYCTLSETGLILEANLTAATLLGVARGALVTQPISRFILEEDQDIYYLHRKQIFETHSASSGQAGAPQAYELRMVRKDGTAFWARLEATAAQDATGEPVCRVALSDITERKREEAASKAAVAKLEALWGVASLADLKTISSNLIVLWIARMSESQYGFYGFVNDDESVMTIHAWSGEAMKDCSMVDKPQQFAVCKAGVWGEAIRRREPLILNDYAAAHAGKKGLPEGHVALTNLLVVPFFSHGRITAVAAVANRIADYGQDDVNQIKAFLGSVQAIVERKQAEESLRESEASLRVAQRLANVGSWKWNVATNVVEWSEELCRINGYDPKRPVPSFAETSSFYTPESWKRLNEVVAKAFHTGEAYELELDLVRTDGALRHTLARGVVDHDASGKMVSLRGTVQDITERKRAEEVQVFLAQTSSGTENEPFFKALARYLARSLGMDFVCIDRLEGDGLIARTVSVWSDGHFEDNVTYALKDTPCGDVVGKAVCCFPSSVRQFFPRDQALQDLRAESYVGATLWGHTGQPIGLIAVIGRRPLANRPLAEATLKLVAVRAAGELERLEAEEVLRESDSRFRQLAESLPQLVWTCRPDGLCDYLSPQWVEFTGAPEARQLAHGWLDQVYPDDRSVVMTAWNTAVATGEPLQVEFRIRHHSGHYHWFDTRATALRDAAGRIVKWFGMNMDITDRKQAEQAARAALDRYRSFLDVTGQLGWTTDASGDVVEDLPSWRRFTGQSLEEIRGWGWSKALHPDDLARTSDVWRKAVKAHTAYEAEYRMRRHDGVFLDFLARGVPALNEDGSIREWVGTCIDITERKRAEEALRESREDLSHAQAVAHTGSWRLNIRRNELLWSDENWRIFGVPMGTPLTYETFLGTVHSEDRDYVHEKWSAALRGEPYDIEHRIVVGDTVKWVRERAELEFDQDGKLLGGFGTTQDITERKEAEEEIRSLARFPAENPNPILRLNREGVILYANEVGGVVLETWRCGIGDRAPDPWPDTIQGALERQLRTTVDLTCGNRIYMLFVTPIAEAGYVNLYATDITEQKRAEEALRQAHDRLEQAVRERTAELSQAVETLGQQTEQLRTLATELTLAEQRERRRLAGLLHDGLQQLLVAARLRAQMLGRSDDPKIQQGSREIAELLAEALADARSLAGELSPPTLQRGDLLPALEWLARWMLEKHHFTVAIHPLVEALPALPEDLAVLLYQGVRELLLNAVKHAQVAVAEVTFTPAGNALTLAVADAGVGFDPRHLRAEGGTQSGFGLLGIRERLGLAGGRLEIASAPGRGSRFTLTVPLHPAPADPAPSHTPVDPDSVPSAGTGTGQDAE